MGTFVRKSNKTWVSMILDESGSMAPQWLDTIGGANSYFEGLRADTETDYAVTIMKFDTEYRPLCQGVPLSEVPLLTPQNYTPRGMTALYDAVGKVLQELESKVQEGDKALMIIVTDGEENSSREHTRNTIKPWIERLQAQGNWTFVYLGAVEDAWGEASSMGILQGNTASYNKAHTKDVFRGMSGGTVKYACSMNTTTDAFYADYTDPVEGIKPEDKDPQNA